MQDFLRMYSNLVDSILSACLLRSGQRRVTDLLHEALETVLELAILASELILKIFRLYLAQKTCTIDSRQK